MSSIKTISYKLSLGDKGFHSDSLEMSIDYDGMALSRAQMEGAQRSADQLRGLVTGKMKEWNEERQSYGENKNIPSSNSAGITQKQMDYINDLLVITQQLGKGIMSQYLDDVGKDTIEELSPNEASKLIEALKKAEKEIAHGFY